MKSNLERASALAIVIAAGLAMAGCEGSTRRIASVGQSAAADSSSSDSAGNPSDSSGGNGGGTAGTPAGDSNDANGAGKILVVAGNVVLGVAQKGNGISDGVGNRVPLASAVTGKVIRVLNGTGQSLVDIGNGRTLLVGGANNAVGKLVSLGISGKTLVGVSSGQPLIGVNLLTRTPVTGRLVTAGALAGNSLAVVDVAKPGTNGSLTGGLLSNTKAGVGNLVTGLGKRGH